jgi:hypothetical protein
MKPNCNYCFDELSVYAGPKKGYVDCPRCTKIKTKKNVNTTRNRKFSKREDNTQ